MKKLLLTGATGMLGARILEVLRPSSLFNITTTSASSFAMSSKHVVLDLRNEDLVNDFFLSNSFDMAIHCAAITDIDYCNRNPHEAHSVHVNSTRIISKHVPIVYYISTDSVFDGTKGDYSEDSLPNPVNIYAKTKYEGEKMLLIEAKHPYVIRTNIFGFNMPMKNSLFEWAYKSLEAGKTLNGFNNVYFNPIYAYHLAELLEEFMNKSMNPGIYHFGCEPNLTKYEFINNIIQVFGFNKKQVKPVALDPKIFSSPRPLNTTLNIEKIKNEGIKVSSSLEGLEKLKKDLENGRK